MNKRLVPFSVLVLVMVVLGFFAVTTPLKAFAEDVRPIYNERFVINRHVDSTRFVEDVVVRNDEDGKVIFEFMAEIDQEIPERWTVFVHDPEGVMAVEVRINGAWKYTMEVFPAAGMLRTISLYARRLGSD